ncbi:MAG: hypothetical protein A3F72_18415 [Bacteroidetes bacterium RIFCSPLOWO2_12_FULL_35_15]|nr:MAG: hypothetical protein A3F72_18415 [Bacteroidetes bacterium RIFCSPLOWO2_12_FULL_35_15]
MKTLSSKIISIILMNILISLSANAITDALKVRISDGTFTDEAVIRFLPNATNNFDGSYDAWKQFSTNPLAPGVFTNIDPQSHLSINALPSFSKETMVDLYINVATSGAFTIQSFEIGSFLPGISIKLEDKMTGMIYEFRKGSTCNVNLFANTIATANRFVLHFSPPTNVVFTNVTCYGMANGALTVIKSGNSDWDYQLKDNSGVVIQSGNNISETATINGLHVGTYFIETTSSFTSPDTNSFVIIQPNVIIADFEIDSAGVMITPFIPILFQNYSSGASSYTWDFGDGSVQSTQQSPIHEYSAAGIYTVTLIAATLNCDVSYSNIITVQPFVTTAVAPVSQEQNTVIVFQEEEMLIINSQTPVPSQMTISIFNTLGQNVYSYSQGSTMNVSQSVKLPATGAYFVNVYANDTIITKKVIYQSR